MRAVRFAAPLFVVLAFFRPVSAQQIQVAWKHGPGIQELGEAAQIDLPYAHLYADASESKRILKEMGNSPSGEEVGIVMPEGEADWFVIFEWSDVGYVKDDDRKDIDADKLLSQIKAGTEAANEDRKKMGISALHVVGWRLAPTYDARTHNLVWAILGKSDDGSMVVNYNVRMLAKGGYMSATLVADPVEFDRAMPRFDTIISKVRWRKGESYGEWTKGDKVAKIGLAALVVGGAGAAAAKLGLFAVLAKFLGKIWKLALFLVIGFGAALKKLGAKLFGGRNSPSPPPLARRPTGSMPGGRPALPSGSGRAPLGTGGSRIPPRPGAPGAPARPLVPPPPGGSRPPIELSPLDSPQAPQSPVPPRPAAPQNPSAPRPPAPQSPAFGAPPPPPRPAVSPAPRPSAPFPGGLPQTPPPPRPGGAPAAAPRDPSLPPVPPPPGRRPS